MKRFFISLLLLCCCVNGLQARTDDVPSDSSDSVTIAHLSAQVAGLSAQVDRLTTRADRWDKLRANLPKVAGYLQAGYEGATGSSTFQVRTVRVWMTGNLSPKIDYMLQVELASPRLLDAFVRYRPFDALGVQIGEFKLPFTIENTEYSPLCAELVECPLSVMRLVALKDVCGIAATGRELGAMASGGFLEREGRQLIHYDLGVFNGEGINTWDKNKSKDVVGRLMLSPVRGLMLAGYCYWGEYGEEYLKRIRYGGGFRYERGLGVIRGEYIAGTTGIRGARDLKSDGWYVLGGIRPVKQLLVAARYDTFLEDRYDTSTRQTNYTAGLTWEPIKYLRCQLDYTYEDYAAAGTRNRNVVVVMFTGIF